jgi:hypothetical protein
MVEAMSEARKSVFKENDCAVSSASSRFTDLSSRMLSSTSQRTR